MASRTFAIDLGARSVKLAIATPGMRGATVTHVVEREVPGAADGPARGAAEVAARTQRAYGVLHELVRELGLAHDSGCLTVNGDAVFTHVLEFGFTSLRRADLVRAVGAELESVVPVDLEDMVYAYEPLPLPAPALVEPGTPVRGRVAATPAGMRVLAYAMRREVAEAQLAAAAGAGVAVRHLVPIGGAAVRLVERVPRLAAEAATRAVAIVDIGHERTDVVVVRAGKATYSRSLARGGRAVTEAIVRQWQLPWADAERAKHSDGFVASAAEPAPSEAWGRIHQAIIGEVLPMARELKQTLAACRAKTGEDVAALVLVGGGARLRGLASLVTEQTGVPSSTLTADDLAALIGTRAVGAEVGEAAAVTIAAALDAAGGRPAFDLRQGDLAAKVDLSFLRAKAVPLAASGLLILAFAAGSAYADLRKLRHAEAVLAGRLATETTAHFKEPRTASQVLNEASGLPGGAGGGASPMPKLTAYDVMLEVNSKLPPRDKATIDVSELSITEGEPDRIVLKGTAKTLDEITALEKELKKLTGFSKLESGDGALGPGGVRQFAFTISTTSM